MRNRLNVGLGTVLVALAGCKDLTSTQLPAGTPNPNIYNSATGAIGLRNAAVYAVEQAIPYYVSASGLLTDELQDNETGASVGTLLQNNDVLQDPLDERILSPGVAFGHGVHDPYSYLQNIRGEANLAIHALAAYDTVVTDSATQREMRAELYAFEGYAEILLADFYCSGVPLSTLDFQGDFTYAASSTTQQVYDSALAKLNSALALRAPTDSVAYLARVLQGRAYLALGQYAAAADDVTTVPTTFQYTLNIAWAGGGNNLNILNSSATVSDMEGTNGLSYRSAGDGRTTVDTVCIPNAAGYLYDPSVCPIDTLTFPDKYSASLGSAGRAPFPVVNGIEARLIEAEAAYHGVAVGTGDWLAQLNTLRQTAITPALPALTDPGTDSGRVALLFHERAYWLFLTGHRQGDLRRLLREYNAIAAFQSQDKVYPTGLYLAPGTGLYGTDVTVPIPTTETANPAFHGCLSRNP